MRLDQEHQITLTTAQCAALLSAAKTIMDGYTQNDRDKSHPAYIDLKAATEQIADGMGLSPEKFAQLLHFLGIGRKPSNPWSSLS